ncbi:MULTISPECIES: hypothetical protein [Cysteiniphilum]|uniref:hypothetical protein n=1 Tax=Cysteiniphilum TaxID=2056696 RepID=UPI001785428A|nr:MULTISPECIES: hypothetical protein [Cysteiniphilum]
MRLHYATPEKKMVILDLANTDPCSNINDLKRNNKLAFATVRSYYGKKNPELFSYGVNSDTDVKDIELEEHDNFTYFSGTEEKVKSMENHIKNADIIAICAHGFKDDTNKIHPADRDDEHSLTLDDLVQTLKGALSENPNKKIEIDLNVCFGGRSANYKKNHSEEILDHDDIYSSLSAKFAMKLSLETGKEIICKGYFNQLNFDIPSGMPTLENESLCTEDVTFRREKIKLERAYKQTLPKITHDNLDEINMKVAKKRYELGIGQEKGNKFSIISADKGEITSVKIFSNERSYEIEFQRKELELNDSSQQTSLGNSCKVSPDGYRQKFSNNDSCDLNKSPVFEKLSQDFSQLKSSEELTGFEVPSPEASDFDMSAPDTSDFDMSAPDTSNFDMSAPDTSNFDMSTSPLGVFEAQRLRSSAQRQKVLGYD